MQTASKLEIYIHIPFCIKKCLYCDFLSAPSDEETRERYVNAIKQEVARKSLDKDYLVTSVFVGGGTPTVLSGKQLSDILGSVYDHFVVADDCEITLECNPGTADYDKLYDCKKAGFNRLSIGLQSANDEELKRIGRIHTFADFERTYYAARKAGFDNVNIDIITALPNQEKGDVEQTIEKIMSLNPRPEHISSYSLILEENTGFMDMYERGELLLPDEDCEREYHWLVIDRLKEYGYEQYELSNLALPGYECRHNIGYWTGTEYLGVGIGAASLFNGKRFSNTRDLKLYIDSVADMNFDISNLECDIENLSSKERMEEFMFLGLRMASGIQKSDFFDRFNTDLDEVYGDVMKKHVDNGLLISEADSIYLSRRGQDLANFVFSDFIL